METRLKKSLDNCGICFEKVIQSGKLNTCSHLFCFQCIQNWSKIQNSCPLCKKRFSKLCPRLMRKSYNESRSKKKNKIAIEPKNQRQMNEELTFSIDDLTIQLFRMMELEPQLLYSFLEEAEIDIDLRMLPQQEPDQS